MDKTQLIVAFIGSAAVGGTRKACAPEGPTKNQRDELSVRRFRPAMKYHNASMMEELDLPDWQGFEHELGKLRSSFQPHSPFLFRGQSDAQFHLTTTLERAGCEGMSIREYYRLVVNQIRPAVETFTGVNWNVPDYRDFEVQKMFRDHELLALRRFPSLELYRYLVYLRHHGFPSPLLDWSHSPYVAAFFAFREMMAHSEKRSIYVYCEMRVVKGTAVGEPMIRPVGPYVRSHPRHFRQQSDYTICANLQSEEWHFHPHEQVFGSRPEQDYLWKFTLPSVERDRVLRLLNDYNLNAFSLFDSEETLLETMWFREHVLERML